MFKKLFLSIKAALDNLDRKQQQGTVVRPVWNTQHRRCTSCDAEFEGNYCPQCGFKIDHARINMRSAVLNFLDVWGMGNRSMWRNIKELFWRPGYMIGDYIDGGQQRYFPPIKMLVVVTLGLALTVLALRIPYVNEPMVDRDDIEEVAYLLGVDDLSAGAMRFAIYVERSAQWLANQWAFELIFITLFITAACTVVLRRQPAGKRLNFAEAFFAIIFIGCQMQLCAIIYTIIYKEVYDADFYPFSLPEWFTALLLCYDFKQLCRVSYLKAAWYTLLVTILLIINNVAFLAIIFGSALAFGYVNGMI